MIDEHEDDANNHTRFWFTFYNNSYFVYFIAEMMHVKKLQKNEIRKKSLGEYGFVDDD